MATLVRRAHWIPSLFVAAFLLVIAANAALVWFATRSFTGLDTNSPYERGLSYNEALTGARQVAALGWVGDIEVRSAEGRHTFVLSLHKKDGKTVRVESLNGTLVRPADAAFDRDLTFRETSLGVYESQPVGDLPIGQWEIRLSAKSERGEDWQETRRLILK